MQVLSLVAWDYRTITVYIMSHCGLSLATELPHHAAAGSTSRAAPWRTVSTPLAATAVCVLYASCLDVSGNEIAEMEPERGDDGGGGGWNLGPASASLDTRTRTEHEAGGDHDVRWTQTQN